MRLMGGKGVEKIPCVRQDNTGSAAQPVLVCGFWLREGLQKWQIILLTGKSDKLGQVDGCGHQSQRFRYVSQHEGRAPCKLA